MMAWICDRCKKPDLTLNGVHSSIILTLTFKGPVFGEEKELKDSWDVCCQCFHDLKKFWTDGFAKEGMG